MTTTDFVRTAESSVIVQAQSDLRRLIDESSLDDLDDIHGRNSSETLMSPQMNGDGIGSSSSSSTATQSQQQAPVDLNEVVMCVKANYGYAGTEDSQLAFNKGDVLRVYLQDASGWWEGLLMQSSLPDLHKRGWFPHNYVKALTQEQSHKAMAQYNQLIAQYSQDLEVEEMDDGAQGTASSLDTTTHFDTNSTNTTMTMPNIDALLGRGDHASLNTVDDILNSVWQNGAGSPSGVGSENDHSFATFSTGGDIFEEIAAAAAATSTPSLGADKQSDTQTKALEPIKQSRSQASLTAGGSAAKGSPASRNTLAEPRSPGIDPDWVPKVSTDGRIFYYNTRTGDSAFDLPSPKATSARSSGSHVRTDSGTASSGFSTGEQTDITGRYPSSSTTLSFASVSAIVHSSKGQPTGVHSPSSSFQSASFETALSGGSATPSQYRETAPVNGKLGAPFTPGIRPRSTYSDDSMLDADIGLAAGRKVGDPGDVATIHSRQASSILTPRKFSTETAVPDDRSYHVEQDLHTATPSENEDVYHNSAVRLAALHVLAQTRDQPTLAELERGCTEALELLAQAIQRRPVLDNGGSQAAANQPGIVLPFEEQESSISWKLATSAKAISLAISRLLNALDVINDRHSTKKRSSQASGESLLPPVEAGQTSRKTSQDGPLMSHLVIPMLDEHVFRPMAMKLTATQSKLIFSIRTHWAQLLTSPKEERALLDVGADAESYKQEELAIVYEQRRSQLTARREIDAKLRFELLVQIRSLASVIASFVDEVEAFAHKSGVNARKDALVVPRRIEPKLVITPSEVLIPATASAGGLLGHGYARRSNILPKADSATTPLSGHFPLTPIRTSLNMPVRPLGQSTLDTLDKQRKLLYAELTTTRSVVRSSLSSHGEHAPQLTSSSAAQLLRFVTQLGEFLRDVESIDLASRLDIELTPEMYAALTGESIQSIIAQGLLPHPSGSSPEAAQYVNGLRTALDDLQELYDFKQELYGVGPALISLIAASSASPAGLLSSFSTSASATPPMQPLGASLLSEFEQAIQSASARTCTALDLLHDIEDDVSHIITLFTRLDRLAHSQALAPADLRRTNLALRAALVDNLMSATTTSSAPTPNGVYAYRGEDDQAEELEQPNDTASSMHNVDSSTHLSNRSSRDRNTFTTTSSMPQRYSDSGASQTTISRGSRSNSMADSVAPDRESVNSAQSSPARRRDGAKDLRQAIQDAGLASPGSAHSPSKSKLKQFFGTDAPGNNLHRPPTGNREAPPSLQPDYRYTDISYTSDGSVRGGTLHALICRLTNHMSGDAGFNNSFLMTYRTFTTSSELLTRLKSRFTMEAPVELTPTEQQIWIEQKQKLVRIRVVNVLRSWITDYLYDDEEGILLDQISAFAATMNSDISGQLMKLIERRRITGMPRRLTASMSAGNAPSPIVPRSLKKIKFLDLDPLEIARQFTIIDSRLFSKITAEECLSKAWPKKFNKDMPTFKAIADMSNAVTAWVAMTTVLQPDVRRRVSIVKHFIAIADKCRQLSNFTTLMHIVAGLNCSAVYRLKRTWELVSQRSISTLTFLGNLMSPENNHALYRDALRLVGSPCVPFLGVYFTDWVMSGEANSDMLRDKPDQINFAKRARVAESIQQIQLQQATPYNLSAVPELVKWLETELGAVKRIMATGAASEGASSDIMTKAYELSLRIEPREREDERIARLLSESGFL